jgi:hypothetical protein
MAPHVPLEQCEGCSHVGHANLFFFNNI